jgi:hypothetical protein
MSHKIGTGILALSIALITAISPTVASAATCNNLQVVGASSVIAGQSYSVTYVTDCPDPVQATYDGASATVTANVSTDTLTVQIPSSDTGLHHVIATTDGLTASKAFHVTAATTQTTSTSTTTGQATGTPGTSNTVTGTPVITTTSTSQAAGSGQNPASSTGSTGAASAPADTTGSGQNATPSTGSTASPSASAGNTPASVESTTPPATAGSPTPSQGASSTTVTVAATKPSTKTSNGRGVEITARLIAPRYASRAMLRVRNYGKTTRTVRVCVTAPGTVNAASAHSVVGGFFTRCWKTTLQGNTQHSFTVHYTSIPRLRGHARATVNVLTNGAPVSVRLSRG